MSASRRDREAAIGEVNFAHADGQADRLRRVAHAGVTSRDLAKFNIEICEGTELDEPTGGPGPLHEWTAEQRGGLYNMIGGLALAFDEKAVRPTDPEVAKQLRLAEQQSRVTPGANDAWLAPTGHNAQYANSGAVGWGAHKTQQTFGGAIYQSAADLAVETHSHRIPLSALFDGRFCSHVTLVGSGSSQVDTQSLFGQTLHPGRPDNIHMPYALLTVDQKTSLCALDEHATLVELVAWMRAAPTGVKIAELVHRARTTHGLSLHALVMRVCGAIELVFAIDLDARRFGTIRVDVATTEAPRALLVSMLSALVAAETDETYLRAEENLRATVGKAGESARIATRMAHMAAANGGAADSVFGNADFIALGPDARDSLRRLAATPDEPTRKLLEKALQDSDSAMASVDGRLMARSCVLVVRNTRKLYALCSLSATYRYHYFAPCQCDLGAKWVRQYAALYDLAARNSSVQTAFRRVDMRADELASVRSSKLRGSAADRALRKKRRAMERSSRAAQSRTNSAQSATDAAKTYAEKMYSAIWSPEELARAPKGFEARNTPNSP